MHLLSPEAHVARLTSPSRLGSLRATGLLDGNASPVLDRLTRLVTRLLGVPISVVSLVTDKAQHFPGMAGLDGWAAARRGTGIEYSFCQYVVSSDAPLVINDAARHPLVSSSPAFTEFGIVGYAGVPLRTADGETLGALCAVDVTPTAWSAEQIDTLEDLAAAAMAEIELRATTRALLAAQDRLREQATRDEMTGLLNRRGFSERARAQLAAAVRTKSPCLVVAMDLDGFKQINDTLGHDAGDEALTEMATLLTRTFRESDVVARMGGDEFLTLVVNAGARDADAVRERLQTALAARNAAPDREFALATSIGIAAWDPAAPTALPALLRAADVAMYADKRSGKAAVLAAVPA
jgi:diguanylate cyclase (GGDEF)-like protein